jgi:hypothetical protein
VVGFFKKELLNVPSYASMGSSAGTISPADLSMARLGERIGKNTRVVGLDNVGIAMVLEPPIEGISLEAFTLTQSLSRGAMLSSGGAAFLNGWREEKVNRHAAERTYFLVILYRRENGDTLSTAKGKCGATSFS